MNHKLVLALVSVFVALSSLSHADTNDQNIKYEATYSISDGVASYQNYKSPLPLTQVLSKISSSTPSYPESEITTEYYLIIKDKLNAPLRDEALSRINRNFEDISIHPQADGRKITLIIKPNTRNLQERLQDFSNSLTDVLGPSHFEDSVDLLDTKVQALRISKRKKER